MNTYRHIRSLFAFPALQDEELDRRARILFVLAMAVVTGLAALLGFRLWSGQSNNLLSLASALFGVALALILLRNKQIGWSSGVLLWTLLGLIDYLMWTYDGIHDIAVLGVPGVLVIAGLLFKKKYFFLYTGIFVLSVVAIGSLEILGVIQKPIQAKTTPVDMVDMAVILGLTAITSWLLSDSLIKSLTRARRDERELRLQTEQLKESEQRYRALFEGANDAIFIMNDDHLIDFNSKALQMFGYQKREDLMSLSPWHLSPFLQPDGKESKHKALEIIQAAKEGTPQFFYWKHSRKNGTLFDADVSLNCLAAGKDRLIQAMVRDVTIRKQMEDRIVESEEYYRKLVDASPDAIVIAGHDGMISFISQKGYDLFGVPRDQAIVGTSLFNWVTPDDKETALARFHEMIGGGSQAQGKEYRLLKYDGSSFWCDVISSTLLDRNGRVSGLLLVNRDISERKRVEDSLRKLTEAVEQSPVSIVITDTDGAIEYVNPKFSELTGYTIDEIIGQNPRILKSGVTPSAEYQMLWQTIMAGQVWRGEFCNKKKNGELYWESASISPVIDEKGAISHYVAVKEDITVQKEAERALQESEELYRKLITTVPDFIIRTDLDGNIVFVNETVFPSCGYVTNERILGKNVISFINEEERDRARENSRLMLERQLGPQEFTLTFEDGVRLDCEVNGNVLRTGDGMPYGMVFVIRDVTERKHAEAERKRLEMQLFETQKFESIGTLAAGIAHDFNNILNIIMGNTSLLAQGTNDQKKTARRIEAIANVTSRGSQLVRQLLTFSRKTKPKTTSVVVNDLIRETARLMEETFPKSVDLVLDLNPDTPAVVGDANQLHQVLVNMCVNARDAMPDGGILTIRTMPLAGDRVRKRVPHANGDLFTSIIVADTGVGMDAELLKRVFDPFFTTKESGKGTGLGLSVVRGIVTNHGGYVDVESKPGGGTKFHLFLPALAQGTGIAKETEMQIGDAPRGSETILVIEDEKDARELFAELMEEKGYAVLTASDGEAGLELFARNRDKISLVITDYGLPKTRGEEICRQLKEINPHLPIIVISGFVDARRKKALLDAGVDLVLLKPLNLAEIVREVRLLLDKNGAGRV